MLLICKQHKSQFKIKIALPLKDLIIEEFGNAQQLPPGIHSSFLFLSFFFFLFYLSLTTEILAIDPLCCCNLIVPKTKSTVLFQSKTEKSDLILKLRGIVEKLNPNTKGNL